MFADLLKFMNMTSLACWRLLLLALEPRRTRKWQTYFPFLFRIVATEIIERRELTAIDLPGR